MPTYRIIIEKSLQFRDQQERYANGYNFQSATLTSEQHLGLIDAVVAVEREIHAPSVMFHNARLIPNWTPGGDQEATAFRDYSPVLAGVAANSALQHPEVTAMAEWPTTKRGVYLRKFYHLGRFPNVINETSNIGDMATPTTKILKLTDGTLPGSATLCRPNGELATGPGKFDPYARTRQFRRGGRRPTSA
jgi:hypothetical protein